VEALPAAEIVAKTVGGRVYCDVVETPSFAERSVKYDWPPTNLALLNHAFDSYLRSADGLSTIGWALGNELRQYGPPVTVIPNYRNGEELRPSTELREWCGLAPGDVLLLASSAICGGFEPVVAALKLLPNNVHLATLGTIVKDYREKIEAYPAAIGVRDRVHFFDPVDYARLTTVASGANLGLMALDPAMRNDRLSLPNRLFDCLAAGLPVVTPAVSDITRIICERQIGVTVVRNEPECWAESLRVALLQEHEMRPRVLEASKELVWASLGDELHAAYGRPASVTIFGYTNLVDHQRTLRMADTLIKRGAAVTICCPRYQQENPEAIPAIRYVFTPHPFSAAPRRPVKKKHKLAAVRTVVALLGTMRSSVTAFAKPQGSNGKRRKGGVATR
jgi:glycosyltransferase involved in cell wall biosynthesis